MFSNQISARDLYTADGNGERDFSQLQNAQFTQFENSQCSQDFFSQSQYSNGSAESQGRRFQTFEKYMAKPSLFRSNSQGKVLPNKPGPTNGPFPSTDSSQAIKQQTSYHQQMNINKNKAKERDERDMLSSIVHIVKECSDEVKQNLHFLKDGKKENTDNLKSSILTLTDQIKESSDKILKSVQCREEQVSLVEKLQKQLHEKDETIQDLLKRLNSNSLQESSKSIIDAVRNFMTDQQTETDKRLQKLFECTKEELKLLKEQASLERQSCDENKKNFQDMKYTTSRQIQDVEKRIVDELLNVRDDFERQKRDMEMFYKNQLQTLQQKQTREIKDHLERGFDNISKGPTEYDLEKQSEVMKDVCKSQKKALELVVKNATVEQSKQYLKQNQELFASYQSNISNDLSQKLDELKGSKETDLQVITDQIDKTIKEKCNAWHNELVPKKVQAQLDELYNYHVSEVQRLEREIENQKKKYDNSIKTQTDQQTGTVGSVLQNVYDFQLEDNQKSRNSAQLPLFQRASGFVSPRPLAGTVWNSRAVFGRTNPSPVATVLPQRKPTANENSRLAVILDQQSRLDNGTHQRDSTQIQPFRQSVTQDQVVPSTPRSRETVQQSLTIIAENRSSPINTQCEEENAGIPAERQLNPRKSTKVKKVSKRRRKKKGTGKKKKVIAKTYRRNFKEQERQELATKSTEAVTVYDFRNKTSPDPVIRKSKALKTSVMPPSTGRSAFVTSAFLSNEKRDWLSTNDSSQSDDDSRNSSPTFSVVDMIFKRKVVLKDRKSPAKPAKQLPETPDYNNKGDLLSTPNLTATRNDISNLDNKAQCSARAARSYEQKRRLCDFDSQVVNLIECLQKRKKITV